MIQPGHAAPGSNRGLSRLLIAAILVPTLALIIYLTVWAYRVGDWTWFALLLATALGLLAFVAAPQLFSLSEPKAAHVRYEWCRTMSSPPGTDSVKDRINDLSSPGSTSQPKATTSDRTA